MRAFIPTSEKRTQVSVSSSISANQ
jgi:hypothetical protein